MWNSVWVAAVDSTFGIHRLHQPLFSAFGVTFVITITANKISHPRKSRIVLNLQGPRLLLSVHGYGQLRLRAQQLPCSTCKVNLKKFPEFMFEKKKVLRKSLFLFKHEFWEISFSEFAFASLSLTCHMWQCHMWGLIFNCMSHDGIN